MRIGKIHNYTVLDAVEGHNTRKIPTGIVADRPAPIDWIKHDGSFSDRAKHVLRDTGAEWEKGKILAVEVLVTTSPEWWKNASPEQKAGWAKANFEFAQDRFGPGLISFIPHLDESTPHVQFVGLPLYNAKKGTPGPKPSKPESIARRAKEEAEAPEIWRLSYHEKFGGDPERLAKLQTRYHCYVAHLGLERGKDTRGLNIRHQTLKEYKLKLQQAEQKLFEQQKAIDAQWAKIAETQTMLEHYDRQLAEKHKRFAEAKSQFDEKQLKHFAETEKFRVWEEAFAQKEHEFDRRLKALAANEEAVAARTADINRRDAQIAKREKELDLAVAAQAEERLRLYEKLVEVSAKEGTLEDRGRRVTERETIVTNREAVVTERESSLETTLAQVAILGRIITRKIAGTWNRTDAKPEFTDDALTTEERKALRSPLPPILGEAMRLAVGFADQRKKLRAKAKKALARLFNSRAAVTEREASAAATHTAALGIVRNATAAQADADMRIAEVERREQLVAAQESAVAKDRLEAEAMLDHAATRIAEVKSAEAALPTLTAQLTQTRSEIETANADLERVRSTVEEGKTAEVAARNSAAAAERQRDADLAAADAARAEADEARDKAMAEKTILAQVKADRAALEADKASLQGDVDTLRANKESLNLEKQLFENERAEFDEVKNTHTISTKLLAGILESNQHARMNENTLEVFAPGQIDGVPQVTVDATGFAPWLPALVDTYAGYNEQWFSLGKIETQLADQIRTLAEQFPEKRAELRAQVEQIKASAALHQKPMWSTRDQQGGIGG